MPLKYSQVAADVIAQKYFRKAGTFSLNKSSREKYTVLAMEIKTRSKKTCKPWDNQKYSSETSAKQVFNRLAGTWTYWGWKGDYFSSEKDAKVYYDEMRYILATR